MSKRTNTNNGMYSGVKCDLCGDDTLGFPSGSIWCPAEDPHPGGHFVVRVAFDRKPKDLIEAQGRAIETRAKRNWRQPVIDAHAPRKSWREGTKPKAIVAKEAKKAEGFDGGFDDFIG